MWINTSLFGIYARIYFTNECALYSKCTLRLHYVKVRQIRSWSEIIFMFMLHVCIKMCFNFFSVLFCFRLLLSTSIHSIHKSNIKSSIDTYWWTKKKNCGIFIKIGVFGWEKEMSTKYDKNTKLWTNSDIQPLSELRETKGQWIWNHLLMHGPKIAQVFSQNITRISINLFK